MKLNLFNNKKLIGISVILFLIALFVALYFFVLYPKSNEVSMKEVELSTQEQILSTLQNKITSTNTNTFQNTVALQKMVPVKPLSQQLLLDIEKAEVVSGSFVVSMSFEDSEVEVPETEQQNAEETEAADGEVEEEEESIPLPTGVKKITVTLNVESPSYFEFEEFLRILEDSERITVVESIDFSANEEIIEMEQESTPLSYEVILSAFYMPTLTDLIEHLPKIATPEPANKKNPFSEFGDYSNSVSTKTEDPVKVETENSDEDPFSKEEEAENLNTENTPQTSSNTEDVDANNEGQY